MPLQENIPFIDPRVEHVGVSKLRTLNATNLSKVKNTLVIQDNDTPLAVLLGYEQYLIIQNKLHSLLKTVELLQNKDKATGIDEGLSDIAAGKTIPFEEIDEPPHR
jgi:PHD/YefM family antitoxin component YafN of YafNO toxin-antitoxin module